MGKGYRSRRKEKRDEYRILVIVCEGSTEKIYFNNFKERNSGVKIKTPNTCVTDPENLVKFALTQVSKEGLSLDEGDSVWCVFDADHHTDSELLKAKQLAGEKVNICFSNPCFELWFLLHYFNQKNTISKAELMRQLEQYMTNYSKTTNYYQELLPNIDEAISRAKALINEHDDLLKRSSNPSTQVYELVEFIKAIVEENQNR